MNLRVRKLLKACSARASRFSPLVWSVRCRANTLSITFDDGPTNLTWRVLECLAAYNAKATFFVLANQTLQRGDVLRQILTDGHEIGIHGYEHTLRDYYGQVRRCEKVLADFGVKARVVRTPRGVIKPMLTLRLWWFGFPTILWSFDAHDSMRCEGVWNGPAPDYSRIAVGDIVLMHDDNSLCIKELPILLRIIEQKSLRCVTVSELVGLRRLR
ncbi:MAG: polysaccharide deacetylase family protein [Thermoguttaceae bacterium]|jgi:peptidoglycan/xylan/chitin deacetylase (PgdA/CDA1 family)